MPPKIKDAIAATRHALIEEAVPALGTMARAAARRLGLGPDAADELWSAGSLRLTQAAAKFDPARGVPWPAYAAEEIRYGFLDAAKAYAKNRGRGVASLDADAGGDGGSLACLTADPRAADPGELAAARECLTPRPGGRSRNPLPDPGAVAAKALALQAAAYAAVSVGDMEDVVAALVRKAKAGDVGAAKVLIGMTGPRATGVTVHQQNVIVHPGDLS